MKLGWDKEIPMALAAEWKEWLKDLERISNFRIERCYKPETHKITGIQLHHFCDASESGYGVVSYLRLTSRCGPPVIAFLMGKARVAPLKVVTIPRLELTSAVLAAKMDDLLKNELELKAIDSVFWTDSTSVLKYIRNDTRRFKTFVANRVTLIRGLTQVSQWRHIRTTLNPADKASRGMRAETLLTESSLIKGPNFLTESNTAWPKLSTEPLELSDGDPEVKKAAVTHALVVHQSISRPGTSS